MDADTILIIVRLLGPVLPEVWAFLTTLFGGGDSPLDADIAEILAMKSPEELEAEVEAGVLPEPWATRNKWLATAFGACATVKTICDLQFANPSSIPDGVDIEKQKAACEAAFADAEAAYGDGKNAIDARDEAGYNGAMLAVGIALTGILKVKSAICPLKKKED